MDNREQKRMLATALRDLIGWHVGMVTLCDHVVSVTASNGEPGVIPRLGTTRHWPSCLDDPWELRGLLPDPEAQTNWGIWLAWAAERVHMLSVSVLSDGWLFSFPGPEQPVGQYASGLLRAVVVVWLDTPERGPLPPSVAAWWAAEQRGAASDTGRRPAEVCAYCLRRPAADGVFSDYGQTCQVCADNFVAVQHGRRADLALARAWAGRCDVEGASGG